MIVSKWPVIFYKWLRCVSEAKYKLILPACVSPWRCTFIAGSCCFRSLRLIMAHWLTSGVRLSGVLEAAASKMDSMQ